MDKKQETMIVALELKKIAERVSQLQKIHNLTNAQMANILDVTTDHYTKRLKTGKQPFKLEKLVLLSKRFRTNYVFTGAFEDSDVSELNLRELLLRLALQMSECSGDELRTYMMRVIVVLSSVH